MPPWKEEESEEEDEFRECSDSCSHFDSLNQCACWQAGPWCSNPTPPREMPVTSTIRRTMVTNTLHEPSTAQIRDALLALPDGPVKVWVGRNFTSFIGGVARMGFLYQYLVAGRVSEVFGKYGGQRRHAVEFKVDGVPAVMFVVKTAKRKSERGWTLRPATLPLDPSSSPYLRWRWNTLKASSRKSIPLDWLRTPTPPSGTRGLDAEDI